MIAEVAREMSLLVFGAASDRRDVTQAIRACGVALAEIVWTCDDEPPQGISVTIDRREPTVVAHAHSERRGHRAIAFLDASAPVADGWLAELGGALYAMRDANAASFVVPTASNALASCGARATLLALHDIPQHERLDVRLALDDALHAFTARLHQNYMRAIVGVPHPYAREREDTSDEPLVSIVTLSWNAPNYTKTALESIRAYTHVPYETIVVDNGSGAETTEWLRTVPDIRVIWNPSNLGFGRGCNQGIAAARGRFVVLLNNDVVVTEGWLEDLLDAHARDPAIGVSAPRSNRIAGMQMLPDADYADIDAMHRYAASRRAAFRKTGAFVDRAIGFCLCIDRRVIDEIGGIDERYGIGNFEDDDFCIRVRAAGYRIYVCDDVFIHHFGSISFQANNVDWAATMGENWKKFAQKWRLPEAYPENGYHPQIAIARGFDRERHFFGLPDPATLPLIPPPTVGADEAEPSPERATSFVALVRDEFDWGEVAALVRRFARAFDAEADVRLAIACAGSLDAATLGARTEKLLTKEGRTPDATADISIDDVTDPSGWLAGLGTTNAVCGQAGLPAPFAALRVANETSPSALKRIASAGA